jgi:hypothetical protein
MHSLARRGFVAAIAGGFALLLAPRPASADSLTIAKGTTMDLTLEQTLDSNSAKVGDTFRAKVVQPLYVEGQMVVPAGTIVHGQVDSVKSVRDGARSGVIGIKFVRMELPGEVKDIDAKLISLRTQDKAKHVPIAAAAPESTGLRTDVVLIGQSSPADGRAHTLVGDRAADDYSRTSLSEGDVTVAAGTLVSMEFDQSVKVGSQGKR